MKAFRLHFLTQTQTNFKCQFIREVSMLLFDTAPCLKWLYYSWQLRNIWKLCFLSYLKITIKISLNTS